MKLKPLALTPALVTLGVIGLVSLVRCLQWSFLERLELTTYDMRAREAAKFTPPAATNLGFVCIDENSIRAVWDHSLGYSFGLYWPRQVYGRLVDELTQQGAKAIAFDIIMGELRPDHPPVRMADDSLTNSDIYFGNEMQRAGNVIIALTREITPPELFLTNAWAAGDVTTEKDTEDGILRRVQLCGCYTNWHLAFRQLEEDPGYGVDLHKARVEAGRVILPRRSLEDISFALDKDGNFDLKDFVGENIPPGIPRWNKPFTLQPYWHMGVLLAARELGLDLGRAVVDLPHGRITLRGPIGLERAIPVDAHGYTYIDWCLTPNNTNLLQQPIEQLLLQHKMRLDGQTNGLQDLWRGKLAIVGSSAMVGNNLTDRGATPLFEDTLLVSKHWNVANSIITGRFIRRAPLSVELMIVVLLCVVAAELTWELRILLASAAVVLLIAAYLVFGVVLYVQTRYWIPLVLPVAGVLLTHGSLAIWRVVFEQAERRRVKSVLSTIVSPKVANVLLQAEKLSLGGARRQITVFFADVRGFTEFTDTSQERVAELVTQRNLIGEAAEACFDEQARESLATVNLYLGVVADTVLKHDGTLDKFIGDCVMAFWGAPSPDPKHAVGCVRAAIDAQRAVYELNQQRAAENKSRELENRARLSAGLPPKPLLPILLLGSGINTGMATVGMMGSEVKAVVRQGNYTVFGREVNLASRLESASGRGRIFIGETTYEHLLRDDPALAATCVPLPPRDLKGFRAAVKAYEVPWRPPDAPPLDQELSPNTRGDSASTTTFLPGLTSR